MVCFACKLVSNKARKWLIGALHVAFLHVSYSWKPAWQATVDRPVVLPLIPTLPTPKLERAGAGNHNKMPIANSTELVIHFS